MEKSTNNSLQLIMSTNDRSIMNEVPLESWTILQRSPGRAEVYNYHNSKQFFDEFRFTGLNNFDFFASDFIHEVQTYDESMSHNGDALANTG